jgi:hypothetical protein
MRTREEIEAALRFAEQQHARAESIRCASPYNSSAYCMAETASAVWASRIDAYRFVLNEERPA